MQRHSTLSDLNGSEVKRRRAGAVDSDSEDESVVEAAINQGSILITNNDITFLLFESVTETDDENETDNGSEGENDFVQGK